MKDRFSDDHCHALKLLFLVPSIVTFPDKNKEFNSIKKKEKLSIGKYGRGRLVLHWVDARTDPNY